MKRPRRSFTFDFKKMIVEMANGGQYSVNQIARDHDISPGLILQWQKKLSTGELVKEPSWREKQLEAELEAYKKKVGELTVAIDVIKKHLNTFQSVKRLNLSVESPRTLAAPGGPVKC
jgi:transposase-like protein